MGRTGRARFYDQRQVGGTQFMIDGPLEQLHEQTVPSAAGIRRMEAAPIETFPLAAARPPITSRTPYTHEPPGGLTAREIERRNEEYWRQSGIKAYTGVSGPTELKALDAFKRRLEGHWARDSESGRLLRELGFFPEMDASGTAEMHSEHDGSDYQLRREQGGYSLHREVDEKEPLQPIENKWPMGRTTGDGQLSSYGEHTAALRQLNEQHARHWGRR
jgi:hypothetical protein